MYQDEQNLFHNRTALTTAGTYKGKAIDLMAAGNDPGPGAVVKIDSRVVEAAGGINAQAVLKQGDTVDSNGEIDSGEETLETGEVVALADLQAGQHLQPDTVPRKRITKRYFAIDIVTTGTFSGNSAAVSGVVWDDQSSDSDWPSNTGF